MFKNFTNWQRFQLAVALLVVFLLVFATNRLDRRHFMTVQNTVTSVYEDRVVAQNYIYELNKLFGDKKMAVATNSKSLVVESVNGDIEKLIDAFAQTKLTKSEAKYFKNLQQNFLKIKGQEQAVGKLTNDNESVKHREAMLSNLSNIQRDLDNLAETQVKEGRQMTEIAQKSLNMNEMLSRIEILFLIVIGLVLQFVIFFRNKKSKNALAAQEEV
ncbi:hypothetical protein [Allomuricauda sp. d1]|uniref:hypothetical protein n=1 Tax=Allomuricauda sp. d1 TaxID=3136725 RepID=UPI0031DBD1EF